MFSYRSYAWQRNLSLTATTLSSPVDAPTCETKSRAASYCFIEYGIRIPEYLLDERVAIVPTSMSHSDVGSTRQESQPVRPHSLHHAGMGHDRASCERT